MASQNRSLLYDVMQEEVGEHYVIPHNCDTMITFKRYEKTGVTWIETPTPVIYTEAKPISYGGFSVLLSHLKRLSFRPFCTLAMAKKLSVFGVEDHLHAPIIEKLFQVIDHEGAVPRLNIKVSLTFVSLFKALERVTLDSLEVSIRETWLCAICTEGLDHYGAVEDQPLITRLPCSHLYHRDCIIQWLEKSSSCPYCRYQLNAGSGSCTGQ